MKKKILSLLLVCILTSFTVLLTGCGEKQNQEQEQEQNVEEQTQEANVEEIYKKYIIEKKYAEETSDWNSEVDEYSILDIDQDGTDELILKAGDMDFYYILICGYNKDSQQVITISDLGSTYGGFRYFEGTNKITYTDIRPFKDVMVESFYKIENNELVNIGSAGQDMGQYFIEEQGNRRNATEDEVRSQFDNAKYPEYQKISTLNSNTSDNEEKQETKNTNTNTTQTANELKIGDYTLKYGTYIWKFDDAAKIVINSDGTASETDTAGKVDNYTYKIEQEDFRQDPSRHDYKTAIVFYNLDGEKAHGYYPYSNTELVDGDTGDYEYSGN